MEPWMDEVGNNGGAGEGCGKGSLAASGGPPLHLHHLDHNPPLPPQDAPPRVPCPPPSRMDAEGEPREGEIGIEQQHTYQQTDRQNRAGPAATASISCIAGTAAAALICVQRWTMAMQSSDASWRFFGAASLHERHEGDTGIGADVARCSVVSVCLPPCPPAIPQDCLCRTVLFSMPFVVGKRRPAPAT